MKFAEHTFHLLDGKHHWLGEIEVEQFADNLISGSFAPRPDFSMVAEVFQRFEEAVNAQALTVVDKLDAEIAALGLCLSLPDNVQCIKIHDIQIWQDGAITCRLQVKQLRELQLLLLHHRRREEMQRDPTAAVTHEEFERQLAAKAAA